MQTAGVLCDRSNACLFPHVAAVRHLSICKTSLKHVERYYPLAPDNVFSVSFYFSFFGGRPRKVKCTLYAHGTYMDE